MMNTLTEICPKCQVASYEHGECRYCDHVSNEQLSPRLNEMSAAGSYYRCPNCFSYTGNDTHCVFCGYMIHEFPYDRFAMTPLLEFVQLFNQKRYAESVFSLQRNLASTYDKHLHDTLVLVLNRYFYGIAPLQG
jgi:hypothetical protein